MSDKGEKMLRSKVIFLGSSGVGKTSLISMFIEGKFSNTIPNTIGTSFLTREFHEKNIVHRMNVWDTAGQEKFESITRIYFKDANAIIIVVDAGDEESLEKAEVHLDNVRGNTTTAEYIILVVNKIDLLKSYIEGVPANDFVYKSCPFYEKIMQFYKTNDFKEIFWTSAKDHSSVCAIFDYIHEKVMDKTIQIEPSSTKSLHSGFKLSALAPADSPSKKSGCC